MKWISLSFLVLCFLNVAATAKNSDGVVSIILDNNKTDWLGAGEKLDILASVDQLLINESSSIPCQATGSIEDDSLICGVSKGPSMISIALINTSTSDSDDLARELLQLLSDRYQRTQIVVLPPTQTAKPSGYNSGRGPHLCLLAEKKKCENQASREFLEAQIRVSP